MATDPGAFSISTAELNGRVVVDVRGELDLATAPELEATLARSLDTGQDVIVDLRGLQFMDSSGLRVLVAARAHAAERDLRFALVRPAAGGPIARILSIAGVDAELEMIDEP
jgi:anti-sigma B factor antagonist